MTLQEVFDTVASHLLTQGVRSDLSSGTCRYRGPNGTKCAVGVLIPDGAYLEAMEGESVWGGYVDLVLSGLGLGHAVELLASLQSCHDGKEPHMWRDELLQIAEYYGLSGAVVYEAGRP